MLIGAHVGRRGGPLASLQRGVEMGAEAVQLFSQSPRAWKPAPVEAAEAEAFAALRAAHPSVGSVTIHATYLINLANPDPVVSLRSADCLEENLAAAAVLGADAVVLHLGSHLGAGLDAVVSRLAGALVAALDGAGPGARILLENTAGAGGTIGRTWEELATVIDAAGGDERLGVCLDTQHLWASGCDFSTPSGAAGAVSALDDAVGLHRLGLMHLNDSKVPLGSNRDRHENLGRGTIGADGLAAILGHPDLQGLPAVLEVTGVAGEGPAREDLEQARRIHAAGVRRWKRQQRRAG